MVTKEEWDALDKKVTAWADWQHRRGLEKIAAKAAAAAKQIQDDARVDPEDVRKPTTI